MKILTKLISWTLTYKLYRVIADGWRYIKDYKYVSESFYSDAFATVLKRYVNITPKRDWLGRIYGVINPNIDLDKKVNWSNVVIEFDDENTNSSLYVKNWVYRQLSMVQAVFNLDKSAFFDYITVDFEHVGPANHDNYLIIFDIVSRKDFTKSLKRAMMHSILYIMIAIATYYIYLT